MEPSLEPYRISWRDMACHHIKTEKSNIILCCPNIYKFPHNGTDYYFEWPKTGCPIPVRKRDLEIRKTIPPGFWDAVAVFADLTDENKQQYLIAD